MRQTPLFTYAVLALSAPLSAIADTETPASSRTFLPGDFEQYAPRTAKDMVERIPGFRISGSGNGERGFGEASQNVLINGQRISSKSTSARDALGRIPAENVEKIELMDGGALDIPGLSGQVVNVTAKSDGISGTWEYRTRYRENLPPYYDGIELSITGQEGHLAWTVGLESDPGRGADSGRENVYDASGNLTDFRAESFTFVGTYVSGNVNLAWTPENGHVANLNAEYGIFEANEREESRTFSVNGDPVSARLFQFSEDEWASEIGGDYEFGLGPGRLKIIGLQSNEHSPTSARQNGNAFDGSNQRRAVFDQTVDESETILRGEYNWKNGESSDWQISVEGALNKLESESAFSELDALGIFGPVDIGDPTIVVEENRAEAFVTHTRQVTPKLNLQLSVGTEVSELMSDGANGQTRTFTRPKGSLTATWEKSDKLTLTGKVERSVGQLDFFDFVSSVDLNQGDDQSGNVDIVPEQSWRAELEAERDFGKWGASNLLVYAEALEDIVDQVPIGLGEGPGNLDSANRIGIEAEGTLNFDPLGWKGAQLTYQAEYHKSEVDDPLTGQSRRINGDTISYIEVELRHDIENTDWAWGATYENFKEAPVFRLNSIRRFENQPGFMYAFIEHKDVFGMTATAFLANLIDQDDQFTRVAFETDRTDAIAFTEDRTRNFGPILTLRLKGTF